MPCHTLKQIIVVLTWMLVTSSCSGSANHSAGTLTWAQPALHVSFSTEITPTVEPARRGAVYGPEISGAQHVFFSEAEMVFAMSNQKTLQRPGRPLSTMNLLIIPTEAWHTLDTYMPNLLRFDHIEERDPYQGPRVNAPKGWERILVRQFYASNNHTLMQNETTGLHYNKRGGSAVMVQEVFMRTTDHHVIVVAYAARLPIRDTVQAFTTDFLARMVFE